jgi:hypothetical protein
MKLDEVERNQQYPLNENDAFMLSGALYFDREALDFYRARSSPLSGQFVVDRPAQGEFMRLRDGVIEVYERPRRRQVRDRRRHRHRPRRRLHERRRDRPLERRDRRALPRQDGGPARRDPAPLPRQVVQHGEDRGRAPGRLRRGPHHRAPRRQREPPAVPNLYRHKKFTRGDKPISEEYGIPMGAKNRAALLGTSSAGSAAPLPVALGRPRGRAGHVRLRDTKPSPRAQDGCNDDRVMSLAHRRRDVPPVRPAPGEAQEVEEDQVRPVPRQHRSMSGCFVTTSSPDWAVGIRAWEAPSPASSGPPGPGRHRRPGLAGRAWTPPGQRSMQALNDAIRGHLSTSLTRPTRTGIALATKIVAELQARSARSRSSGRQATGAGPAREADPAQGQRWRRLLLAMAKQGYTPPPIVEIVKRWDEAKKHHDVFVRATSAASARTAACSRRARTRRSGGTSTTRRTPST